MIKKNWQVGIMLLDLYKERTAHNITGKTIITYTTLHWNDYTSHDSQYLYFNIDHRYNDMDPESLRSVVK